MPLARFIAYVTRNEENLIDINGLVGSYGKSISDFSQATTKK